MCHANRDANIFSNNRINTEGSVLLGKGLAVNETMKVLKVRP